MEISAIYLGERVIDGSHCGETAILANTTKDTTDRVRAAGMILYIRGLVKVFLVGLDVTRRGGHISRIIEEEGRLNLVSLIEPIVERLPEDRRKIMEAIIAEYEPGDTQRLLLALVAAASKRERQLMRVLLRDMEVKEEKDRVANENQ